MWKRGNGEKERTKREREKNIYIWSKISERKKENKKGGTIVAREMGRGKKTEEERGGKSGWRAEINGEVRKRERERESKEEKEEEKENGFSVGKKEWISI